MANLREFSSSIRETLARLDRILDENRSGVKGTVANIDELSGKLKTTADNLNSITGKIDSGQGTIGKLVNDEETHQNLNDALTSVKTGVEAAQHDADADQPDRARPRLPRRVRDAQRRRGRASSRLDVMPRENKFYRFELIGLPNGRRYDETYTLRDVHRRRAADRPSTTTVTPYRGRVRHLGPDRLPLQEHDPPGRTHRVARRRRDRPDPPEGPAAAHRRGLGLRPARLATRR